MNNTEQKIKANTKQLLLNAGWEIEDNIDNSYCEKTAIFDFDINWGTYADCVLFIQKQAVGVIELKGSPALLEQGLDTAQKNAEIYSRNIPPVQIPLPFIFSTNGKEILFKDLRLKSDKPTKIKNFYTPQKLTNLLNKIPYSQNIVQQEIDLFYCFLKIASSIIYNNKNNLDINKTFSVTDNEVFYQLIQSQERYSFKKLYKFAYFLFYELHIRKDRLKLLNIDFKTNVKDLRVNQFNNYQIKIVDKINLFDDNIVEQNNIITITYSPNNIDINKYPNKEFYSAYNETIGNEDIKNISNVYNNEENEIYANNFEKPSVHSDQATSTDLLGREIYAEGFAKLITNQELDTPLSIGIFGKWGSGKTSFLKEIEKFVGDKKEYHFVHFNAWKYDDQEKIWAGLLQEIYLEYTKNFLNKICYFCNKNYYIILKIIFFILLYIFILCLASIIDLSENIKFLCFMIDAKKITGLIKTIFIITGLMYLFFKIFKEINNILEGFNYYFKIPDYSSHLGYRKEIENDLDFILDNMLGKINGNKRDKGSLVLFIDDLDRCSVDRIVQVIDCLNVFLSRKGVIAFLAIDPIYLNCLSKSNKEINYTYFEKIIHIPFLLPENNDNKKYLLKLLNIDDINVLNQMQQTKDILKLGHNEDKTLIGKRDLAIKFYKDTEIDEVKEENNVLLAKEDQSAIYELEKYLPRNPRQIKRYINIYVLSRYFLCNSDECETYNPKILASWLLICCTFGNLIKEIKDAISNNKNSDEIIYNLKSRNLTNAALDLVKHFIDISNQLNMDIYFKITNCFLFNEKN